MTNQTDIENIRYAFKMGAELAKSIKVGDVFLGAWPAADALGFAASTLERSVFTTAYLDNLPSQIVSTRENVIVAIEARR